MTEQEKLLEKQEDVLKKMKKFSVKTTAKKVRTTNTLLRLLLIILVLLILLMSISWACARFVNSSGFTVSLDSNNKGLSLFDNPDNKDPTTRLSAEPVEDMWNISYQWLPEGLDKKYGAHNGDADKDGKPDYLAYTFALGNDTDEDITYDSMISVEAVEKNADNALRVRLIRNGDTKTYAKQASKGGAEKVAADATWISSETVMKEQSMIIKSKERVTYTVVLWLEGDDPECVNDILGGKVKLSMNFVVQDDEAGNGELKT